MLTAHDTEIAMEHFFKDCLKFWSRSTNDEREAFKMALNDVRGITTDPFDPFGKALDVETKNKFIKYREMDLGIARA